MSASEQSKITARNCPHPGSIRQLFDRRVRDVSVCVGPDAYYLTGTTYPARGWDNEGIEMWRSADLQSWEHLGFVWQIERDGTWQRRHAPAGEDSTIRAIWAPEVHYLNGTFWLPYSMPGPGQGCGLLRSTTGDARGPYTDISPDAPLVADRIDASLFQDEDGTSWYLWQGGEYAALDEHLARLDSNHRIIRPADHPQVGFEGAFLFKAAGSYHFVAAEFLSADGKPVDFVPDMPTAGLHYASMVSSAPTMDGPWSKRYVLHEHAGHTSIFQRRDGQWMATIFGNDECAPIFERPGLVALDFRGGRWTVAV